MNAQPTSTLEVTGLVISTVDLGERDRLVTVLTAEHGVITFYANGARSLKSRYMAATQMFCYCVFFLSKRGDRYTLKDAELKESFFSLRTGVEKLALANYLCEIASYTGTSQPDTDLLRLMLNTLYATANDLFPIGRVKAAFEIRCAAILGFMPELSGCSQCGCDTGDFYLDVLNGNILCAECKEYFPAEFNMYDVVVTDDFRRVICILSPGARAAMQYAIKAPLDRLFSFSLSEEDESLFYRATEAYLLCQLDHSFPSLSFYKQVT